MIVSSNHKLDSLQTDASLLLQLFVGILLLQLQIINHEVFYYDRYPYP